MKLTNGTSVIGGNLLRIKVGFNSVRFVILDLGNNWKLHEGSDKFIKGYNDIPIMAWALWTWNELRASIIKSSENMEHPSGIVVKASGGLTVWLSVKPENLCSMELEWITDIR